MTKKNRRLSTFGLSLLCGVVIVSYQNCGELRPSNYAVTNQSLVENRYRKDSATISKVLGSSKSKIWISAKDSSMESSGGSITKVLPMRTNQVEISVPAGKVGPKLVDSASLGAKVFEFDATTSLQSASTDMPAETHYSMVALLEGPLTSVGNLVSMRTASLHTSELAISFGSGSLRALNYFDADNFAAYGDTLYANNGPIVVAVTWNDTLNSVFMQINGKVVNASVVQTGAATDVGGSQRQFAIGSSVFRAAEVISTAEALSQEELNSMSRFVAERWKFTGVIVDPSLNYSDDGGGGNPDALPAEVKRVLSTCSNTSCHSTWSLTSSYFKTTSLVIPGDYLNSKVYNRMQGTEGTNTNKTMPQGGATLPAPDILLIKTWIQNLK